MSDLERLKALYEQYKKIKTPKFDNGGEMYDTGEVNQVDFLQNLLTNKDSLQDQNISTASPSSIEEPKTISTPVQSIDNNDFTKDFESDLTTPNKEEKEESELLDNTINKTEIPLTKMEKSTSTTIPKELDNNELLTSSKIQDWIKKTKEENAKKVEAAQWKDALLNISDMMARQFGAKTQHSYDTVSGVQAQNEKEVDRLEKLLGVIGSKETSAQGKWILSDKVTDENGNPIYVNTATQKMKNLDGDILGASGVFPKEKASLLDKQVLYTDEKHPRLVDTDEKGNYIDAITKKPIPKEIQISTKDALSFQQRGELGEAKTASQTEKLNSLDSYRIEKRLDSSEKELSSQRGKVNDLIRGTRSLDTLVESYLPGKTMDTVTAKDLNALPKTAVQEMVNRLNLLTTGAAGALEDRKELGDTVYTLHSKLNDLIGKVTGNVMPTDAGERILPLINAFNKEKKLYLNEQDVYAKREQDKYKRYLGQDPFLDDRISSLGATTGTKGEKLRQQLIKEKEESSIAPTSTPHPSTLPTSLTQQSNSFTPVQEAKIQNVINANPGSTRDQIINALKKAGKI
jgi:hypothetical protein